MFADFEFGRISPLTIGKQGVNRQIASAAKSGCENEIVLDG